MQSKSAARAGALCAMALALVASIGAGAAAQTARYSVIDLHEPGAFASEAWAVNRAGVVVGDVQTLQGGPYQAFGWSQGVRVVYPVPLGVASLQGHRIGDGDLALLTARLYEVVGRTSLPRSFLSRQGVATELSPLPGDNGSQAVSINKSGVAVGVSVLYEGTATGPNIATTRAVIWRSGAPLLIDPGMPGATGSSARDINDNNAILGITQDAARRNRPWILTDAARLWLEGPPGSSVYTPVAMNNFQAVVGLAYGSDFAPHAAADLGAGAFELGGLGGPVSAAYDINDKGQIVGSAQRADYEFRGFLWENGVLTDLTNLVDDPVWVIATANNINEDGWIVGVGRRTDDPSATRRAVLLKPIDPKRGQTCPSDFNGDGATTVADLLAVLAGMGSMYTTADLLLVLQNWGTMCEVTPGGFGVFGRE